MGRTPFILAALCALPAAGLAQDQRQLDAHEHGVSTAEIAVEGGTLVIDLFSPGMDIVGFEHAAESDADRHAVAAAVRQLSRPDEIVTLPEEAGCRLSEVLARLETGEDDHGGEDAHAGEHADEHEEHADDHEEHGDGDHAHDDHAHDDHAGEAERHSEFRVRYAFACDTPDALTEIGFPFFSVYENAREIEAQFVTESGAGSAEIGRDRGRLVFE